MRAHPFQPSRRRPCRSRDARRARRFTVALAAVLAAFLLGSEGSAARPAAETRAGAGARVTRVAVTLVDFHIRLSAQRVPAGRVVFNVSTPVRSRTTSS
jgi:hypothetical protein